MQSLQIYIYKTELLQTHLPNRALVLILIPRKSTFFVVLILATMTGTSEDPQYNQQSPPSPRAKESDSHHQSPSSSSSLHQSSDEDAKKWGTHVMGAPAVPTVHPDNQKAALWRADEHQHTYHQPYVQYSPVEKPSNNPFEPVIHTFNSWSRKAETIGRNIWHNCKLISCSETSLISITVRGFCPS